MDRIRKLISAEQPLKWLFYGDSITHGAYHTFGQRDYVELFTERVRFELGRVLDVVIKTAISGDTTRGLLAGFDWRVAQFKPDVVLVMIGMNDCSAGRNIGLDEFRGNLLALADRLAALGALAVLQTTCPILPGTSPDREPNYPQYMDAIRSVAAARHLPLIDHQRYWSQNAGKLYYWMSDAFHPNELGHRAFALLLYRELGIEDPASACCRLFIP